ncbi:LysR family transcriptional regulator [Sphingomonas sp. CGMCC 1.13654]|uniref:LysR family transcriptional regulator n=1 Tax=Sphingomonas chungangi TaxID=2683589 RepID=A0A838L728_9SPHN|nr:LysR family transcriptional regulator [Sphingomonas chungangi]MBA2934847.1 LysR family transcriptional regulator [Sphingomonas chungangi]MVW58158.1 LysR family transcriptional regulator [Sphingomonas chungangi]
MDRDYRLLELVVEMGSISAAGQRLGLSPAAASKRLAALEERLGARLVNRTTRRLSTTQAGQAFYEEVRAILAAAEAAEARVSGRAEYPSGLLRVSAPTSFGRLHVAPHLPAFLDRYPDVSAELLLDDGYTDLIADRIDVAIRIASEPESTALTARLLAPNRRILCAAPIYLEAHGAPASLDDLQGHHLLAARHQSPWRLEGRHAIDVESVVATNSSEVVRELCLAGMGIALRSTWDVGAELASGALRRVLPDWQGATDVAIWAVHAKAEPLPAAVTAYVDHMAAAIGPVPWEA